MAPVAVSNASSQPTAETLKSAVAAVNLGNVDLRTYSSFDSTPSIGTEFLSVSTDGKPVLDIRNVLADEAQLKALGRLVSERGVVFFRDAVISPDEQKTLVDSLGRHGGKPASSTLHIHPCTLPDSDYGDEISLISNKVVFDKAFKRTDTGNLERPFGKIHWVSTVRVAANSFILTPPAL
jgi:hypothetical protein